MRIVPDFERITRLCGPRAVGPVAHAAQQFAVGDAGGGEEHVVARRRGRRWSARGRGRSRRRARRGAPPSLRGHSLPRIWPPRHLSAHAAVTPSGVPPMPNRMSVPELRHATEIAPAMSPSWMSRMRAPASRHSRMRSAWRSRSRMTAVTSLTFSPSALATASRFAFDRRVEVDDVGRGRAGGDLLHVDARAGVEHRAALGHRDHRDRAGPAERGERGAVDRVDRDVDQRRGAVAELLAVVEHRRFVLLALADDDDAVHRHAVEHDAHRLDRGTVGRVLVAAAHPAAGCEGGGLRGPHELHGEVAIGALATGPSEAPSAVMAARTLLRHGEIGRGPFVSSRVAVGTFAPVRRRAQAPPGGGRRRSVP